MGTQRFRGGASEAPPTGFPGSGMLKAHFLGAVALFLIVWASGPASFGRPSKTPPGPGAEAASASPPALSSSDARRGQRAAAATLTAPNDTCTGAETIPSSGPFPYLTSIADFTTATSAGDPVPTCQTQVSGGVWFSFTPSVSANYTFSTCQSVAPG